jgi:hypothetical protein
MNAAQIQVAIKRIVAGEKATLVVAPENMAEAEKILSKLPRHLRSLLTLVAS